MNIEHETPEEIGLIEVTIVTDDDHEYLIPKDQEERFHKLNDLAYKMGYEKAKSEEFQDEYEVYEALTNEFSLYKLEGTCPPLYAKLGYEKEL